MRISKVVMVAVMNGFLAGFFLAQFLARSGGAENAPITWLLLAITFALLSIWRVRMIWRAERRNLLNAADPMKKDEGAE